MLIFIELKKIIMFLNTINKKTSTVVLLSAFFFFIATGASASTTISTNISTSGTLTVSGASTLGSILGSAITLGTTGTATGQILMKGTTSGTITIKSADVAGTYTLTLPADDGNNGQYLKTDGSGTLSWATSAGSGTVTSVSVVTANGVSGSVATSDTTPAITLTLGAITPSTVNGNTITTGTGTLTLGASKILTVSNTLTLAGTDGSTLNIGTGGTLGTGAYATIADYQTVLTNSAGLLAALSDEVGTGVAVFNNSPTIVDDITVGTVGTATGQIKIKGTTSGTMTLTVPAEAGTPTYTLPAAVGAAGSYLKDAGGNGTLSWATPAGSGTVTSVGVVAPIGLAVSGSPVTASGNITLAFDIAPTFIPFGSATRTMATSTALSFNSGTGALSATTFVGALTGNADTVTGLAVTAGQTLTVTTGGTIGTGAYATIANYATLADPVFTGSLAIPQGASPTVDAAGEIAQDTTDDQLLVGASAKVIRTTDKIFSFTLASTSPEFFSGGSLPIPPEIDGYTITSYSCYVTAGTSVVLTPSDGTNDMDAITCGTTITSDVAISANAIATAGELMQIKVGAIVGAVDYVSLSAFGTWTRE